MKIQSAKGTRDFYPQVMAVRNYIVDGWKAASLRSGFEEYDGPIFEFLKMYQIKSGDEIASQLFSFTDRGGRNFAIRPEITPTLARMVNQQINALPRPIKWFSLPRLCRAERPQKGRLREFFQWNVDIIGADDILADAEVIFTAIDYLHSAGLGPDDIVVKISSRKMLSAILETIGIGPDKLDAVYAVLDKKPKLPDDTFQKMIAEQITDPAMRRRVIELMSVEAIDAIGDIVALDAAAKAAVDELRELFETLELMGIVDFVKFDIGIVRGLAYYTGVVYEIYDRRSSLRAICGGGRYNNLLKDFGGPSVPATGFGMGDAVLEILLRQKGLLTDEMLSTRNIEYFIAIAGDEFKPRAVQLTTQLRLKGLAADFSYKSTSLKKQLKAAQTANAKYTIILGSELTENNQLVVKDMATGNQEEITVEAFLKKYES
ncbi:MAG: histidine--tRNA ligase [Planctomycetota bacterium]|nr:MAG: histidine--tRNA ligase [Planctomycetota bacterium]